MVLMPTYYAFGFDGGTTETGNRLAAIAVRVAIDFPQYSISTYRSGDAEDVGGSVRGIQSLGKDNRPGQNERPDNTFGVRPVAGGGSPGFGTGVRPETPGVDVVGIRPDYIDGRGRPGIELLPDRTSNRPGDVSIGVRPGSGDGDSGVRPEDGFDIIPDRPDVRPGDGIGVRPTPGTPTGYRPDSGVEVIPDRPQDPPYGVGVRPTDPDNPDRPTLGGRGVITFIPSRPEEPVFEKPNDDNEPEPGTIQTSFGFVTNARSRVNIKYQLSGWLRNRNG